MAFLYGQTTQAALANKLLDLIAGNTADDHGTTVPSGDRWRVRLDSGATTATLAAPASQDQSFTQQHRTGYWARYDDCCLYNDKTASGKMFVRQTSILTSWIGGFQEGLLVTLRISQANTTSGDYSTARVQLYATTFPAGNSSTSTTPTGIVTNSTLTPASDGTVTWTYTSGTSATMTFKIGDASTGIVTVGGYFYRWFNTNFRGGIDVWRRSQKNVDSACTFTTSPPGTAGTDYALNIGPNAWAAASPLASTSAWYNYVAAITQGPATMPSNFEHGGLGIKTNAALTGDRYVAQFTVAEAYLALLPSLSTITCAVGGIGFTVGGIMVPGKAGSYASVFPAFLNHGAAATGSVVQYWISVTATHLAIVLNADNGAAWRTSSALVAKITADDAAYGTAWLLGYSGYGDRYYRLGSHSLVEQATGKGAGFHDNGRDWQTGSGRMDFFPLEDATSSWSDGSVGGSEYAFGYNTIDMGGSNITYWQNLLPPATDRTTLQNYVDQRWIMQGLILQDAPMQGALTQDLTARTQGRYRVRGTVGEGFLLCSTGGYNQGDELTDTATGNKYLLWQSSSYTAPGGNNSQGAAVNWGFALPEV